MLELEAVVVIAGEQLARPRPFRTVYPDRPHFDQRQRLLSGRSKHKEREVHHDRGLSYRRK